MCCGLSVRLSFLSPAGSGNTYHLGRFTGVESILRAVQRLIVCKRLLPTINVGRGNMNEATERVLPEMSLINELAPLRDTTVGASRESSAFGAVPRAPKLRASEAVPEKLHTLLP